MPKEITHWWLASSALASLAEKKTHPRLSSILEANKNLFLLGAVAPDFPFYYLLGSTGKKFSRAAMLLHGSGGTDTLAPLARTAKEAASEGKELSPGEWAFLFGYACHVAADTTFHPLVLFWAGKGDVKAMRRHYTFESVLDLYVTDVLSPQGVPKRFKELTRALEMKREDFLPFIGRVCFGGNTQDSGPGDAYSPTAKELETCLSRYESVQAACWSPFWQFASRLLAFFFRGARRFPPAFYQKKFHALTYVFAKKIAYRHPVTGEERETTIENLKNETVRRAHVFAEVFEKALAAHSARCQSEALAELKGPNLETDIYADTAKKIVYTSAESLWKA